MRCFRYHKGTDFQANHNWKIAYILQGNVVLDTTKVLIFKQITTIMLANAYIKRCFRYHKGTDFQANHNSYWRTRSAIEVVLDTTKVLIFKQITTLITPFGAAVGCFRYHKGTDFQANHNSLKPSLPLILLF